MAAALRVVLVLALVRVLGLFRLLVGRKRTEDVVRLGVVFRVEGLESHRVAKGRPAAVRLDNVLFGLVVEGRSWEWGGREGWGGEKEGRCQLHTTGMRS